MNVMQSVLQEFYHSIMNAQPNSSLTMRFVRSILCRGTLMDWNDMHRIREWDLMYTHSLTSSFFYSTIGSPHIGCVMSCSRLIARNFMNTLAQEGRCKAGMYYIMLNCIRYSIGCSEQGQETARGVSSLTSYSIVAPFKCIPGSCAALRCKAE